MKKKQDKGLYVAPNPEVRKAMEKLQAEYGISFKIMVERGVLMYITDFLQKVKK